MTRMTGTWALTRFALRRDRVLLPTWILVFSLMTVFSASATMALYPDEASRVIAASAVNDVPVAVALYGRIWDPTSLGALSLLKMAAMGGVMIGILAVMLVTRHARAEEERGRTELLGSTVVGAWAGLTAAVLVAGFAMAGIGVLSALGLWAIGLPAAGSWAFGLSWAVTGLAFAGVAAVTNQLTTTGRAATGLALVLLAVAYLMRAVGDVLGSAAGPSALSWLSPIGWGQQVRPFAGDAFWVLVLPVLFTVAALGAALVLQSRRDLGAGLLPERAGRARAVPELRSPVALAWRLQYPMLLGWLAAYAVMGAVIGSIVNDLGDMMDTPQAMEMITALGGTDVLMEAFIAVEFSIMAFVTAAYGIVAARRLATEELDGHAEMVLAAAVPRTGYLMSHVAVAVVGTTLLTLTQGASFALGSAATAATSTLIGPTIGAAMAYLPAIWLMTGIVVLLYGLAPRLTFVAWVLLVGAVIVSELGALLEWPQWVLDASPFTHVPQLPAATMTWTPVVVLMALAFAVTAAGALRFRRRDLATP
jgi:ABC-2 type transport system permease protein